MAGEQGTSNFHRTGLLLLIIIDYSLPEASGDDSRIIKYNFMRIQKSRTLFICFLITALMTGYDCKSQDNKITVLVNAKIYPSATSASIENGIVVIENGKIKSIGKSEIIKGPANATVIDCKGMTVLPGFWNSHVHFISPILTDDVKNIPASQLTKYLQDMLTKYGFTHVFDIGSFPKSTFVIRQRIENGEVDGPSILTTGPPLVPENGTPFYVKEANLSLPELSSPAQAKGLVNFLLDTGVNAIKIFAASPVQLGKVVVMPKEIATAVVSVVHAKGKLVFAHPTSNAGIRVALASGVDIIAHTTPDDDEGWDKSMIDQMLAANLYLIPTIKLWKWEAERMKLPENVKQGFITGGIEQLSAYKKAGGKILFGTDVGYMSDFDPTDEYVFMEKAGMSFKDILLSMTITPAQKFKVKSYSGKLEVGMDADIVILKGDPEKDIKNLSQVKYTIRKGKIIYSE